MEIPKAIFSGQKLPSQREGQILAILLLGRREGMYGLEIMDASDGELTQGTIYGTLMRMSSKGYVESYQAPREDQPKGPPLRRYRLTGLGEEQARRWLEAQGVAVLT